VVTGATGFIGGHLVRKLKMLGAHVYESPTDLGLDNEAFRSEFRALRSRYETVQVVHLGGMSHIPTCEQSPDQAYRINTHGTLSLAEALRSEIPESRLLFASTAQLYRGPASDELGVEAAPWTESRAIEPQSHYAKTKWEAEQGLNKLVAEGGLSLINLRLFNHTHHSQGRNFFLPSIHHQLSLAVREGRSCRVQVGNLDLNRDLGAIQDLLDAFVSVLALPNDRDSKGESMVLNVCSGVPKNLLSLASRLAAEMKVEAVFEPDPALFRQNEPKYLWGSHEKLSAMTGWQPRAVSEAKLIELFLAAI